MTIRIDPSDRDIAGTLERLFTALDVRVRALDERTGAIPQAVVEFRQAGIRRLFEALAPMIELARARIAKGMLTATSASEVLLAAGAVRTFTVDAYWREVFAPSPMVLALRRLSPEDGAVLRVTGWDAERGRLDVVVDTLFGDPGPHDDWELISGPGLVTAQRALLAQTAAARDVTTATAADVLGRYDLFAEARAIVEAGALNSLGYRPLDLATVPGQSTYTIPGGYTLGRIAVYSNGSRLTPGKGFTATDGTTLTLADPSGADDTLHVTAFGSIQEYSERTPAQLVASGPVKAALDALAQADDEIAEAVLDVQTGLATTQDRVGQLASPSELIASGAVADALERLTPLNLDRSRPRGATLSLLLLGA